MTAFLFLLLIAIFCLYILDGIFGRTPLEQFQAERDDRHAQINEDILEYRRNEWLKQINSAKG